MNAILLAIVILAAIVTIACGIWVATSLLAAVSSRKGPTRTPSPNGQTVDSES